MKEKKYVKSEKKVLDKSLNLTNVLNKKNELDNVNDLWYFVKSSSNRWICGSAH